MRCRMRSSSARSRNASKTYGFFFKSFLFQKGYGPSVSLLFCPAFSRVFDERIADCSDAEATLRSELFELKIGDIFYIKKL